MLVNTPILEVYRKNWSSITYLPPASILYSLGKKCSTIYAVVIQKNNINKILGILRRGCPDIDLVAYIGNQCVKKIKNEYFCILRGFHVNKSLIIKNNMGENILNK
jgi:hypothetical protein